MGLDEFLIPQESSPATDPGPLGDLDEVLLAPPMGLDAPEEPAGSGIAAPLKTALIESPPTNDGREAAMPSRASESAPSLADVIVAAPSTDEERVGTVKPAGPESIRLGDPKPRDARPSPPALETSGKSWEFLATAWDSAPPPSSGDVGRIDDEFVSTSPLTRVDWGAIAPANSISTIPGRRTEASPSRSMASIARWDDGFSAPTDFGKPLDGPVDGPDFENDLDGLGERLSRIVDRLERTVERFAPPSTPLGARPRPFRGRIDG